MSPASGTGRSPARTPWLCAAAQDRWVITGLSGESPLISISPDDSPVQGTGPACVCNAGDLPADFLRRSRYGRIYRLLSTGRRSNHRSAVMFVMLHTAPPSIFAPQFGQKGVSSLHSTNNPVRQRTIRIVRLRAAASNPDFTVFRKEQIEPKKNRVEIIGSQSLHFLFPSVGWHIFRIRLGLV